MVQQTEKNLEIKNSTIVMIATLPFIANYTIIGILLGGQAFYGWPGLVHVCTGSENKMKAEVYGGVFCIWMTFIAIVGIVADVYLIIFQKLKKNVGENVSFVTQKSIFEIPLSSVMVTLIASVIFILCLGLLLLPIEMEPERFVILITYGVLHVPLITGFTGRLDKHKVVPALK